MKLRHIVALLLLTLAGAAGAQGAVFTTELQSVVPPVFTLKSDLGTFQPLNISAGASVNLGKLSVYTNAPAACTVVIQSASAGKLKNRSSGQEKAYPYTLKFGSFERIDLSKPFMVWYAIPVTPVPIEYPIGINYSVPGISASSPASDIYDDSLSITISVI